MAEQPATEKQRHSRAAQTSGAPAKKQRERNATRTRERLFNAAIAEFRRAGVEATTIDSIATACGVSRGTFYFHFPTKDDVLAELVRRSQAKIVTRLERALEDPRSAKRLFEHFADEISRIEREIGDPALYAKMAAAWLRLPVPDYLQYLQLLSRHLESLQEAGKVRDDHAPRELSLLFSFTLTGMLMASEVIGADWRRSVETLIELFSDALSPIHQQGALPGDGSPAEGSR